ncbi:MAG: hypothetical protein U1E41_07075 [Paracoccus sp. (in: a-proteobacteria)]
MSLDSASEYALSFSEDAVHLQRREKTAGDAGAPGAWRHLGSVEFDSTAFHDEFALLRGMAQAEGAAADDAPLPVTLLIPDDQILYTTLSIAPGADREKAVARALDGLTPYAIEDLAFDWEGDGDSVRVAAVARQTLREASDFARQYGFDGQVFRAMPGNDNFSGEPVFALLAPARARPAMDPARAGVTAAALMIEPDPQEDSLQEDAPQAELDLGADEAEVAADVGADIGVAAKVEMPEAAPAPASAEAASETAAAETVAEAVAVATEAAEAVAAPAAIDEPAAASPAETTAETTPETTADAAKAPPVVRHAPARPVPGKPEPAISRAAMNPRAQAVHDRAAEARQTRAAEPPVAAQPRRPGERGGLLELVGMLGALVLGLILIWAFLVPDHKVTQVAETSAPATAESGEATSAAMPEAPAEVATSDAVTTDAATGQGATPPEAVTEAATETAPDVMPETAPGATAPATATAEAVPAETMPAGAQPDAPLPVVAELPLAAPQAPAANPVSALTEEERRRVIVAAAAVAAAVVPPSAGHARPATPPAETVPAETGPAATAPAATAAATAPAQATTAKPAAPATRPARPSQTATPRAPMTQKAAVEQALRDAVEASPARLQSSARPQLAPRRSTPRTSTPSTDAAPRVPTNPLPYEAAQARQPKTSARPPGRTAAAAAPAPAATPAKAAPEATPATATNGPRMRGSARPPGRPEGSAPDLIEDDGAALTPAEQRQLHDLRRALGLGEATAAPATALEPMAGLPPDTLLAQARPTRKPKGQSSDAASTAGIDAALRSAIDAPPGKPGRGEAAAAPARDSGGLLRSSVRPRSRPGAGAGAGNTGAEGRMSDKAVEAAIAAAVDASPATPGGVQLSALASSPLPPRRGNAVEAAVAAAAAAPTAAPTTTPEAAGAAPATAAPAGPDAAEIAERRRLDEQLQAQAEARVRARAQADAQAEAQARAQAEARARAQVEAEERAALASRQQYKPAEVDDEPEVAAAALSKGVTSASVAQTATQKRGMNPGRTTIIGIIGAGQASRALIRLRNGNVVTVRLGDRIDGGTINSIGDGRLTYVKAGRLYELRMLDGR